MMYSYGTTQQGPYHVQKNIVCQDFHYIKKVSEDCVIAAVADGLGSESHSDVASKIAATESVEYCVANLPSELTEENASQVISDSFMHALQKITDEVAKENGDINQYDTTLCLAIYKGSNVYFGQSGDSGAIVLCKDGHYEGITKQQRDENGCVFPLAFGKEKWEFGSKSDVASLLLATDGMLEIFFPVLLYSEKVNIYVALAQFFMDNLSLKFDEAGEQAVQEKMSAFVQNILEKQVNDDKTVLVIVNDSIKPERLEDSYYQVPNWAELQKKRQEEFNRLAYPHLYAKEKTEESKEAEVTISEATPKADETNNVSTEAQITENSKTEKKDDGVDTVTSSDTETIEKKVEEKKEPSGEKSPKILQQITSIFKPKAKKE